MPTEQRRNPLMLAIAVGILVLLGVWIFIGGNSQSGQITNSAQYMDVLNQAQKLSEQHFQDIDNGLELTEPDKKDLRQAAGMFDSISEFNPNNIAPYLGAAKCYQALGNDEAAIKRLRKGLSTVPNVKGQNLVERAFLDTATEAHYLLAKSLFNEHQYNDAIQEVSMAMAMLHTPSPIYLTLRAEIYIELRKYIEAKGDLAAALSIDPNYAPAKQRLSFLAHSESDAIVKMASENLNKKDYKAVVADCDRGLKLDPDRTALLALRGAALIELGRKGEAQADVEHILKLDPENEDGLALQKRLK